MKALIFMLVSGFILCLPHAQAIAANSVCQKVCAGGDQKCLDCCAENYGPVKQTYGASKSCIDDCSSKKRLQIGKFKTLPACVEECQEHRKDYVFEALRQACNPDANNEDEYKVNKDRLYRACLQKCVTGPVMEMGDPEKCRQDCRRILTD